MNQPGIAKLIFEAESGEQIVEEIARFTGPGVLQGQFTNMIQSNRFPAAVLSLLYLVIKTYGSRRKIPFPKHMTIALKIFSKISMIVNIEINLNRLGWNISIL